MDLSKIHCLTLKYDRIANCIMCSVNISFPLSLLGEGETAQSETCLAIWDTGATGSAVTELTARKLNLEPTGIKNVSGLGGTIPKNTYVVDIVLPNNVRIPNLTVTELDNPVDLNGNKVDNFGVLIGMDIISKGDFSITNFEGKTVMSFRIPSIACTDYVREWNVRKTVQDKTRRN